MTDLSPAKGVSRDGDVVRRPIAPWSPAVRALLHHLERAGFAGAPRALDGAGHDTVTWVDGVVDPRAVLGGDQMAALGDLLRRLHDATDAFAPPDDAKWQPSVLRPAGGDIVIGHGDVAPWNLVVRDGLPVALIDWELAGPVDRLRELAHAAWLCGGLFDDGTVSGTDLPAVALRAAGLRGFADGYRLPSTDRVALVGAIVDVAILTAAADAREAGDFPDVFPPDLAWGVAWRSRSAAWVISHRTTLLAAITG